MVEEGNQNALLLQLGQLRKSAFATKHGHTRLRDSGFGQLTHCFFDDVVSVDLLVLVHISEQGKNVISSTDPPIRGCDSPVHGLGL